MKKFFVLWSSQVASMFGSTVVGFALAWYIADKTGSAAILSTAMMMNVLPVVFLGPFIGSLIDRWDRKKIMIYSDLITMLLTVLLVVLFYTGAIQLWHIYVVLFFRAAGGAFQQPAFNASIPLIVPEKHLVRANGLNSALFGAIYLVGPPAGASLMRLLPMQWVLSVDVITALIAIGCLLPLAIPRPLRTTLSQKANVIGDMVKGFRYVASWKPLLFLIVIGALLNFFAVPGEMLLPMYVKTTLGGDYVELGYLGAAFGGGIIAGGLILGAWGGFKKRIHTLLMGFILYCIASFIFGFTTERLFFMGLSMWFLAGMANALANAPIGAILQSTVPKDMQGRVFSVLGSSSALMIPISLAIFGPVADAIGMPMIYRISGVAQLIVILAGFYFGNVMSIEKQKAAEKPAGLM